MIEIFAIGGYEEVGKNMTAVKAGDEIIILDMGLNMDKIVSQRDRSVSELDYHVLKNMDAVPNDEILSKYKDKVKAIVVSHAHLDHVGAVTKMAGFYNCPIIATPFTLEVLKNLMKGERKRLPNKLITLNPSSSYTVGNIKIEFIYATHSTPQTVIVALHTKEGVVVYANDWKFDQHPVLGKKTDYKRLKALGEKGVLVLISDSVRIDEEKRALSENLVREMLRDILSGGYEKDCLIIVTTFASHIARIKTLLEICRELKRVPFIMGRAMRDYISAAEKINLVKFSKVAPIFGTKKHALKALKSVNKEGRNSFFLIMTGCQGEPDAMLTTIANNELDFELKSNDQVLFCSSVIPSEMNIANRSLLEKSLKQKRVRIFTDIHASGHAQREDHRDMLMFLKPKNYIPCHGDIKKLSSAAELGSEMGYKLGENMFILRNGQRLEIK